MLITTKELQYKEYLYVFKEGLELEIKNNFEIHSKLLEDFEYGQTLDEAWENFKEYFHEMYEVLFNSDYSTKLSESSLRLKDYLAKNCTQYYLLSNKTNYIYFESEAVKTEKKHYNDAGYDLRCKEKITIQPGEVKIIDTGAYVNLQQGFFGKIEGRSSLNMKGIISVGGVIDADYRGEIKVGLLNTTQEPYTLEAFSKIAQIIIMPCDVNAKIVIGKPENNTLRGSNGFGSTGK